ncbi:MAG TPA: TonB family protein [Terracidiphilus sp.]|nr:TonB family protein [Terracidiphilus sp.]
MSGVLEGSEQLERELTPEPVVAPAMGAIAIHLALVAAIVLYGILGGFFHHMIWGNQGSGGAIQVNLVSSALPLPSDQPPNQNVLSTETPSQAPAPPEPKAKQAVDETAIPIAGKQVKPKKETAHKTAQHEPPTKPDNRARYGEQSGSSMPRAAQTQSASIGPTTINAGDFGSRFGWYVEQINNKMAANWNKREVDPSTPKGGRVYLVFTIRRDGSPTGVQLDRSSGSPTLDLSCERGVQRVDTFGPLPSAYNSNTLKVSYYCEY